METAISQRGVGTGLGLKRFLPLAWRWARLFLCVLLIWAFMFIVAPWVEKMPAVAPIICFIDENYIDAGALYYTEIEEFFEAEIHMENTMNFAPRGHSGSL
jgi:hypothetical protein